MASMRALLQSPARIHCQRHLLLRHSRSSVSSILTDPVSPSLYKSRPIHHHQQQHRCYIPLTKDEEEEEKSRVASLSDFAKEQELRKLNREIARLEMLKGINTGELYTWSGKYKALARDYGMPLLVWYWGVWGGTFVLSYGAIDLGGVDVMSIMMKLDVWTGWDISANIKPEYGKIGLALALNEVLEPIRLPVVIMTVKPVMDRLFPPKF